MSEGKDSAIKLFGKMIQIQLESPTYKEVVEESGCGGDSSDQSLVSLSRENDEERAAVEEPNKAELLSSLCNGGNQKAPENDKEESLMSPSKEEHSETSTSEEKALMKKPDKIIPCPRCNSMDTKFCYFNNYNVNQPRHFCKNCQRYWTAGGTMRNVPVGAGRRKNKSAPSLNHHHHPMVIPEARNGLIGPVYTPGSTVLTFGSDAPLCESMASALKIAEKSPDCVIPNGIMKQDLRIQLPFEKRIDGSSIRSEFNLNMMDPKGPNGGNFSGFPGPGWPYTWNPIPLPSALPFPFYATPPFWNTSGSWTLPVSSPSSVSVDRSSTNSSPNSPTLGKHSRDGNTTRDEKAGPGVVTPKMLRINDPNEAAKSSIWGTLGIRNKRVESNNGSGFFKGFESKGEETRSTSGDTSLVLQANPAAFSRSLAFHESIE